MILDVSSASLALQVLKAGSLPQAPSGQQGQDSAQRFIDPRATLALSPQTFDRLLHLKIDLQLNKVPAPQIQQSLPAGSSGGTTGDSSKLGWLNQLHEPRISHVTSWLIEMKHLYNRTLLPTNSPLLPWNDPEILQQLIDMDEHEEHADIRERAIRASDVAVYSSMAQTSPEDRARIKALGGEIWYDCIPTYDHIEDREMFRNIRNSCLYGANLSNPVDPNDRTAQAFLNGTARILRSSDFPDLQARTRDYNIYAFSPGAQRYKWIASTGGSSYNDEYLNKLKKKIPDMELSLETGYFGESVFVFIPKTAATASKR